MCCPRCGNLLDEVVLDGNLLDRVDDNEVVLDGNLHDELKGRLLAM